MQKPGVRSQESICLVCGKGIPVLFLDFGHTALANNFLAAEDLNTPEPTYPLRVGFCRECGHVQLLDRVAPEEMFSNYLYVSSASSTLTAHLQSLASAAVERFRLKPHDLVVDIGSNDGTLLSAFSSHGVRALGVDPAANLATLSRDKGIETVVDFFGVASAAAICESHGLASVITATNSFPHIPRLDSYLEGVRRLLAPEGTLVIEAHYLLDLLDQCAFDTIYHEHVSYWGLRSSQYLFRQHGLDLVDAERLPIHHGQIRMWVRHRGAGMVQPSVEQFLAQEHRHGVDRFETFEEFGCRVQRLKHQLRHTLADLKRAGDRIAGYGAPAKATTFLSFLELGPETLDYIADRSALKQGRYTPGSHIPIVSPEKLLADQPDYVVVFAWNFIGEIAEQLAPYRERGGRLIVPVPEVRFL